MMNNPKNVMMNIEEEDEESHSLLKWRQSMGTTITSLLPKLNIHNIRSVANDITRRDLTAARGPFCRALIESQSAFPRSTNVYASLASIVNSKFPDVGLLLVKRVVLGFKEAFASKDKNRMHRTSKLIAHLVNQTVVYEVLALDVLLLLLGDPAPDNIEVAVGFCMECGSALLDYSPLKLSNIYREFRRVLKRGMLDKRSQVSVVKLLGAVRKSGFKRHPSIVDGLDLVAVEDQVTHEVSLLHDIHPETSLDEELKAEPEIDECGMFGRMRIGSDDVCHEITSLVIR